MFKALAEKKAMDLVGLEAVLKEAGFSDATETEEPSHLRKSFTGVDQRTV